MLNGIFLDGSDSVNTILKVMNVGDSGQSHLTVRV